MRAVDNADNKGKTDHYDPIKIKTYHYIEPYVYNDAPPQKVTLYIDEEKCASGKAGELYTYTTSADDPDDCPLYKKV